uniref:UPF0505 protein C16orf62 homolog n=1 Tax=Rhizophora mucronata TaxID=61149 RepID=A0A2P2LXT4_RHIMU
MEFRPRDYRAERESHALPRVRADEHPLETPSPCPPQPLNSNIEATKKPSSRRLDQEIPENDDKEDFVDPLRSQEVDASDGTPAESNACGRPVSSGDQVPSKEWSSFKRFLMQKFPVSKMISVSSKSDLIIRSGKVIGYKILQQMRKLQKLYVQRNLMIQKEFLKRTPTSSRGRSMCRNYMTLKMKSFGHGMRKIV